MAGSNPMSALPNSALPHVPGARAAGSVNLNQSAEVSLFIRAGQETSDPDARVQELGNLRARSRQHLTSQQVAQQFGADLADLAAVEQFANSSGLTVVAVNSARRTVRLTGTLGNLAQAFGVQFATYQSSQGAYRGYTGQINVPSNLADIVQGVFGLDNKPQSQFHVRKRPATRGFVPRAAGAQAAAFTSYSPNQIASLYNFPTDVNGEGQCIGIIEFGGGFNNSDLATYFQGLSITPPSVVAVSVGGAFNFPQPGPNSPDDEVMLDIEVAGSVAPAAQIVVYFAPNTSLGWLDAAATAIFDTIHNPQVLSISWGGPENSWTTPMLNAMNYLFQLAGTRGITICVAAGDSGYNDGGFPPTQAHVDFPASSPYVLACGGTHLNASGGQLVSEKVWNDTSGATGGGVSTQFAVPAWQSDANVPPCVSPPYQTGRGVPDVAGDADPNSGYNIRVDGQNTVIGGTSAVAPLWAGLLTLAAQKAGASLGFINPLLYSQATTAGAFNDIVNGNNGTGGSAGYSAGPGWDACTGWGTPNGAAIAEMF